MQEAPIALCSASRHHREEAQIHRPQDMVLAYPLVFI